MATELSSPNRVKGKGKHSRKLWIKLRIILGAVALIVAVALPLRFYVYPKFQQKRLLKNARNALNQKQYSSAVIFARRAVQADPGNVEANRFLADLADLAKSPEAIFWRKRLTKLEPNVLENYSELAKSALANNKIDAAEEAVASVPESARKSALYHSMAAHVALAARKPAEAEAQCAEALKLEPSNQAYQLNLAALRINSSDSAVQSEARATLDKLLSNPALRSTALQLLIQDSINSRDWDKAVARGRELGSAPDATFDNKLLNLTLLNRVKHRDFTSYLTKLQEEAAANPETLSALMQWMNKNGLALLAVEWSKHLPADLLSIMPVPMALAQSYVAVGDWAGLNPILSVESQAGRTDSEAQAKKQPAPEWADYDFMRSALRARSLRAKGSLDESHVEWSKAIQSASSNPEALTALAHIAIDFGWENEAADILWMLAQTGSSSKQALAVLNKLYAAKKSTRDLFRVASRWYQVDPSDLKNKNNLASYYLLLGENVGQGIKLADELHKAEPENPVYSSTWAYALHLQGQTDDALKIMKSLGQDILQQPEYAAYYGVILASAGKTSEAKGYLDIASNATLLPEETKLIDSARQRTRPGSSNAVSATGTTKK